MTVHNIDFTGLWKALPSYNENLAYVYVDPNGDNINLNIPFYSVPPGQRDEQHPSYGKYIVTNKTIKIPKEAWLQATSLGDFNNDFNNDFLTSRSSQQIYPKSRDLLTYQNRQFQVSTDIDTTQNSSLYRLSVNILSFIPELQDTLTYIKCTSAAASDGSRVVTNSTPTGSQYTNIPAAIEPMTDNLTSEFSEWGQAPGMLEHYDIYTNDFNENNVFIITPGDMFLDQNGYYYEIISVHNRLRLDEKPLYHCVRKPGV